MSETNELHDGMCSILCDSDVTELQQPFSMALRSSYTMLFARGLLLAPRDCRLRRTRLLQNKFTRFYLCSRKSIYFKNSEKKKHKLPTPSTATKTSTLFSRTRRRFVLHHRCIQSDTSILTLCFLSFRKYSGISSECRLQFLSTSISASFMLPVLLRLLYWSSIPRPLSPASPAPYFHSPCSFFYLLWVGL